MVIVHLEPDGKTIEIPNVRSVLAVLNRLKLRSTMALVARDGELLTADRKLSNGDTLLVRKVTSAG
ncbi:ubiquitin family protein [Pseudodesulfovibrio piezophilus]|uniref:Thiamine biosynthesis protein ThiS n=1 Tax=Pseudodesulfovibrio piezophilus (strain DSM 21447 / JCM 15486 / C1TLV30) TaxID=1322246 RepID=M1WJP1_PSEP2|nr:hypothetical protein [Pseudodesulfovibrio piezophilus]CCH48236.1 conserved protein of unknown function [Pseudodesulfovibrio piezophilus C1TLV30]